MGSKTTTSSSQTQSPWSPAVPYLTGLLGEAQGTYDQTRNTALPRALATGQNQAIANATGGATTAAANSGLSQVGSLIGNGGQTATGTAAIRGINAALGAFGTGNRALAADLTPIADGSQIGANNPAFQQQLQSSLDKASDTIASRFSGAGRYGSASFGNAEAKTLGDIAAGATASQYNTDRSNQLAAIGQLSGVTSGALSGAVSGNTAAAGVGQNATSNLLAGIGSLPSLNASQNADASNLQQVGNGTWNNLDNYASLISSIGGMGGSGQGTQTQSSGGGIGGIAGGILGGLGALKNLGGIAGLFSDRRLKEDVSPVGALFDGQVVYRYRYRGDPRWQIGLMAQDVRDVAPEAVAPHESGYLMVDYGAATESAARAGAA